MRSISVLQTRPALNATTLSMTVGENITAFKGGATYRYGFEDNYSSFSGVDWGSMPVTTFKGVNIEALYSQGLSSSGYAYAYYIVFQGNRASGFFSRLFVDGTEVVGSLSRSYISDENETIFAISLGASSPTLFTPTGSTKSITLV